MYRKYFIVSRAYSNFLTFILRAYFQMCLLLRGRTLIYVKFLELKISEKDKENLNQLCHWNWLINVLPNGLTFKRAYFRGRAYNKVFTVFDKYLLMCRAVLIPNFSRIKLLRPRFRVPFKVPNLRERKYLTTTWTCKKFT